MDGNPITQHKHYIARTELRRFYGQDEEEAFGEWLTDLVDAMDMKLLSGPHMAYVTRPGLQGWTGVCIIETSHIAIHVWDEEEVILAQLDVYTCGEMNTEAIVNHMDRFDPYKIEFLLLDREHSMEEIERATLVYDAYSGEDHED